jgi:hypothetical protein
MSKRSRAYFAIVLGWLLSGCYWKAPIKMTLVDGVAIEASDAAAWNACIAALKDGGITLAPQGVDLGKRQFFMDGRTLTLSRVRFKNEGVTYVSISEEQDVGDTQAQKALGLIRDEVRRRGLATKDTKMLGQESK